MPVLTDAQLAALSDSGAPPAGNPGTLTTEGGYPLDPAQAKTWRSGHWDPAQPKGSQAWPFVVHPGQQLPPGSWGIVPGSGQLQQGPAALTDQQLAAAPEGQPDFGTGFYKGMSQPWDNLSNWYRQAERAIPGEQAVDRFIQPVQTAEMSLLAGPLYRSEGDVAGDRRFLEQQDAQGKTPGGFGQATGNVISTAPIFALARGPALGGAISGAMSTDQPGDPLAVARDASIGAAGGKLGDMGVRATAQVLGPVLKPEVQKLIDAGLKLTPGQILGGPAQTVEDALTAIPGLRSLIQHAQGQGVAGLNVAATNRALAPIGETVPKNVAPGWDALTYAADRLGGAYHANVPHAGITLDASSPFQAGADAIGADSRLSAEGRKRYTDLVAAAVLGRASPEGAMTGEQFKAADSELGFRARQFNKGDNPENHLLADALERAQGALRDTLAVQHPDVAPQLQAANEGWANLARLRAAARGANVKDGIFSPSQLAAAVRSQDGSPGGVALTGGHALMQDLANAGEKVLKPTVGDSGTSTRNATIAALAEILLRHGQDVSSLVSNPFHAALAAGGTAAAMAPYTGPGLAASRFLLGGPRPAAVAAVADALRRIAPAAGPASSAGALRLADYARQNPEALAGFPGFLGDALGAH